MNAVGDMVQRLERIFAGKLQPAAAARNAMPLPDDAGDLLAAAISEIAAHYGMTVVPAALVAGLPLVEGRLPLEHCEAAAARAGLHASVETVPLVALQNHELPVIVMMDEGGCDVLWELQQTASGGQMMAILSAGGSTSRIKLPVTEISQAQSGRVVRLRPRTALDERGISAAPLAATGWFLPAFLMSRRIYGEAIAATLALNLLALALPLFTMNIYDRVLPNAVETTLWALAIGVALATIFDFLIKTLRANFVDIASRRADVVLSNHIYGRLLGARTPNQVVSAGIRANALREFETLREFFNSATLTAFGDVPFLVVFLVMIWAIAGSLALIPTLAIPIVLAAGWLTQRKLSRLSEQSFRETAQKNAIAVETVVGLASVKAAGAESWAAAKWEAAVGEHIRSSHQIRDVSNFGINTIFAIQTLTQVVMIVAGFYMVAAGHLTTGGLIAGTMLAGRALQPLGQIAMLISRLNQTRLAFRALNDIVNLEQERPDGARLQAKAVFSGALKSEGLTFTYDKDAPPCLVDVSFDIKPGERVGLIGSIGSGKSTLLKIMHAVHIPNSGRMLADGIPVHHIDPALLRMNVGLALQDADLFHGTIRSNIALADPGASDEDVIWAARAVGALEWILRLPKGFETPVRERGAGLSGGQRQSVALARAVFRKPRILLLDEPTSDMDLGSEQLVVQSLRACMQGRTLVAVSHRPAMLALVDRLIVLEGGRKLFDGPKDQVIKQLEAVNSERAKKVQNVATAQTGPAKGAPS